MDIFALTETEFFRKLRQGLLDENLHVDAKEFLLCVHEVSSPSTPDQSFVLDALIIAEIELQKIMEMQIPEESNQALTAMVKAARKYILHKIEAHKSGINGFVASSESNPLSSLSLNWKGDKTEFMELCYALKIGKCFGEHTSTADIVRTLAKVFNVEVTPDYAKKRFYESKYRGARKSYTAFLDKLKNCVRSFMGVELEDEASA